MEADYGILYFCGLPLERIWTGAMAVPVSHGGKGPAKPVEHETGNRTLLLIGAPIATRTGLGDPGNIRIAGSSRAFYALPDFKELYLARFSQIRFCLAIRRAGHGRRPMSCWQIPSFPAAVVSTGGASGLSRARSVRQGGLPARWLEDVACVMSAIGKSHTW